MGMKVSELATGSPATVAAFAALGMPVLIASGDIADNNYIDIALPPEADYQRIKLHLDKLYTEGACNFYALFSADAGETWFVGSTDYKTCQWSGAWLNDDNLPVTTFAHRGPAMSIGSIQHAGCYRASIEIEIYPGQDGDSGPFSGTTPGFFSDIKNYDDLGSFVRSRGVLDAAEQAVNKIRILVDDDTLANLPLPSGDQVIESGKWSLIGYAK